MDVLNGLKQWLLPVNAQTAVRNGGPLTDFRFADRLGEGNRVSDVRDFDVDSIAGARVWNDYDEPTFDFRDSVTLIAERIDSHGPDVANFDWWAL